MNDNDASEYRQKIFLNKKGNNKNKSGIAYGGSTVTSCECSVNA